MMNDTTYQDQNQIDQPLTTEHTQKRSPFECKICGGLALHSNYGVVVCDACKIFFRRNAQKKQNLKCPFDGHCQINISNRHICSLCRLGKCFTCGMQIEMIRARRTANDHTKRNHAMITTTSAVSKKLKEQDRSQQFPTLNVLRADQPTLTVKQQNLLSNITRCYDEYNGFTFAENFIEEQKRLPAKMRFKSSSVNKYFGMITGASPLLYEKNADFISLCRQDRSLLLHNTMKYVAGLTSCSVLQHTRALENENLYQSVATIYGSVALDNIIRAINQLDSDDTFVKLVLTLLVFSTFNYTYYTNMPPANLMNIKEVLRIQDMYAELIWQYLLQKYDHERVVRCFSKLIRHLLLLNDALVQVIEHEPYNDMIDLLIKQTEAILTVTE